LNGTNVLKVVEKRGKAELLSIAGTRR